MSSQFVYRLQVLLDRKEEARKDAERELARREQELRSQQEKLESLRLREQKLREHRDQLRRELLSNTRESAVSAREVQTRSEYVKQVGLDIDQARSDVVAQGAVIEQCQGAVREATQRAAEARREVEVLSKHRAKQQERFLRELQAKEDLALDEIGNVLYSTRRHSL